MDYDYDSVKVTKNIPDIIKAVLLAALPILDIYDGISVVGLGSLILLILMFIEVVRNDFEFEYNLGLFALIMFYVVYNLALGIWYSEIFEFGGYFNNSVKLIQVAVLFAYFAKKNSVDREKLYGCMEVIALISTFFIYYQWAMYTRGQVVLGIIPFLKSEAFDGINIVSINYGRPNSIFLEPAHYSIYVIPVFVLAMQRKKYIVSMLLLIGLVVSTSSTGLFLGTVFLCYFVFASKKIHILLKSVLVILSIIVLIVILPNILLMESVDKLKMSNLVDNIRVFGTLDYFKYYDIREIIFGVGLNRVSAFLDAVHGVTATNYSNVFVYMILTCGLVGELSGCPMLLHCICEARTRCFLWFFCSSACPTRSSSTDIWVIC